MDVTFFFKKKKNDNRRICLCVHVYYIYILAVCATVLTHCVSKQCFPIVSGSSPTFDFFSYLFSFYFYFYLRMLSDSSVILSWCIGFDAKRHTKLPCLPIVSGHSPAFFFHSLIFSFMDAGRWFCDFFSFGCTGFDVHQHAKFQPSMSPGMHWSLISVSQWLERALLYTYTRILLWAGGRW